MTDNHTPVQNVLDAAAGVTMIASLAQWLPPMAALFTVIWTALRIYEWVKDKKWK
jgi:hypothetical protein